MTTIKRGDTNPPLAKQLRNAGGEVVPLSNVVEVSFHMRDENYNTIVDDDTNGNVTIVDAVKGKVKYEWVSGDTSDVGSYKAEFAVDFGSGRIRTFPAGGNYSVEVVEDIND